LYQYQFGLGLALVKLTDNLSDWFLDYLSHRKQFVSVG